MTTFVFLPLRTMRGALLPFLILMAWEVSVRWHLANPRLLASPSIVFATTVTALHNGDLWFALRASVERMLCGLALGTVAGLLLGTVLGLSKTVDTLIGPSFHAVRQIAVFAWIPLISMWFGLGEAAKVTFIALVALFPVVVNTYEGIKSVAPEYVEVAKVFAFSRWRLLQRVVLPAATPSIITGIELAVIYAWLATIGAEYLMTTTAGVGSLLLEGREQFRMDIVLLGIVATGLVGWLLSSGTRGIGAYLLRWRVTI